MTILSRYIFKELMVFFLVSLFAFTGILLTIRMLKFASLVINKGVEFSQIAMVFVAIIPTFLEIAIPLATLLGVMLAFARLSGDSEIVVMRGSGISIYQLLTPVLMFGLCVGLISLYVSMELRPWGFQQLSRSLFEIARSKTSAGLDSGVFNKMGALTLYAEKIDPFTGALDKVLIDDRRDRATRKLIIASSGAIIPDEATRTISLFLREGSIHELENGTYGLTRFTTNKLAFDSDELQDSDNEKKEKQGREMYIPEIRQKLSYYTALYPSAPPAPEKNSKNKGKEKEKIEDEKNAIARVITETGAPQPEEVLNQAQLKKRIARLSTELGLRFSMPFAAFILALVAIPLGIQPPRAQRAWGSSLSAVLGMGVFVCYYALLSLGITLGESGRMNSAIGLWIPNLAAASFAAFAIWKLGSEQWNSIAQGFDRIFGLIGKMYKILPKRKAV